ncbi:MAG: DUF4231 domain-containing protein [Chloroflexota bacterium]|nr:DUF4231 domain-containing protein [Chloroflexota bacterium]
MIEILSQISEKEGKIKEKKFHLLLGYLWILANAVAIPLVIIGTVNWWIYLESLLGCIDMVVALAIILSLVCSIMFVISEHMDILSLQVQMATLKVQRKNLIEADPQQQEQPNYKLYKEEVLETIEQYQKESKRYRDFHNLFQWIIIIGSILVTSTTSAVGLGEIFKWISVVVSILVSISAGITGYYKFREKSFYLQKTADDMGIEYSTLNLSIRRYKGKGKDEALILFAEYIESLKAWFKIM